MDGQSARPLQDRGHSVLSIQPRSCGPDRTPQDLLLSWQACAQYTFQKRFCHDHFRSVHPCCPDHHLRRPVLCASSFVVMGTSGLHGWNSQKGPDKAGGSPGRLGFLPGAHWHTPEQAGAPGSRGMGQVCLPGYLRASLCPVSEATGLRAHGVCLAGRSMKEVLRVTREGQTWNIKQLEIIGVLGPWEVPRVLRDIFARARGQVITGKDRNPCRVVVNRLLPRRTDFLLTPSSSWGHRDISLP